MFVTVPQAVRVLSIEILIVLQIILKSQTMTEVCLAVSMIVWKLVVRC